MVVNTLNYKFVSSLIYIIEVTRLCIEEVQGLEVNDIRVNKKDREIF